MLKKILDMAAAKAEAAEVLAVDNDSHLLTLYNHLDVDSLARHYKELAVRVIKDGKLGTCFGSLEGNAEAIVEGALRSAEYGAETKIKFINKQAAECAVFDPELAEYSFDEKVADAQAALDYMGKHGSDVPVNVYSENQTQTVTVLNTAGLEASYRATRLINSLLTMFHGSKEGINKENVSRKRFRIPEEKMDELIAEYRGATAKYYTPSTRRMRVIFRDCSTWTLMWRLLAGTDGNALAKGITPLADKVGTQLFHEGFTIYDDPTVEFGHRSFPFDDEGTPTTRKPIIEKGVLKNFIFGLDSAARTGSEPSGNAFKQSMWTAGIEHPATPRFTNLYIEPGNMPYEEMIKSTEEGLVVNDVIGFHSGNMLTGQYSMNVGMGFYVKDGKIKGRCVDTMISGNVYEDFKNLAGLSPKSDYNMFGYSPDICLDNISVSGKE